MDPTCNITAHTVLLCTYYSVSLTYTVHCTLYILHILYTVYIVYVPCFPVSDVEVSPSTSVRALVHPLYKSSLSHFSVSLSHIHILTFTSD